MPALNSPLDMTVFIIQDKRAKEVALRDLMDYVETTSRPDGIGPKHYVRDNGKTLNVCVWQGWGGPERVLSTHESAAEAIFELERIWANEILSSPLLGIFGNEQDANDFINGEI